jgi:hypothetical protein
MNGHALVSLAALYTDGRGVPANLSYAWCAVAPLYGVRRTAFAPLATILFSFPARNTEQSCERPDTIPLFVITVWCPRVRVFVCACIRACIRMGACAFVRSCVCACMRVCLCANAGIFWMMLALWTSWGSCPVALPR